MAFPSLSNNLYSPWNATGVADTSALGQGLVQNAVAGAPLEAAGDGGFFSLDSILGNRQTGQVGWGMPAIAAGGSVLQGLLGMKQLGLAQDQLKESQRQYNQNYNAQVKTTNTQLEDRQRARVAANPGAYESVSSYLDKNKVV